MITPASLQLPVENALGAFITAQEIFPTEQFLIHSYHKIGEKADVPNYLVIKSGIADWTAGSGHFALVPVEFTIVTDVADSDSRADQATAHQDRLGDLDELFFEANFLATIAALNAVAVSEGIAFSAWQPMPDSADGHTDKQLTPTLQYKFNVYRLDF